MDDEGMAEIRGSVRRFRICLAVCALVTAGLLAALALA
jgi:hypothetical protein